QHLRGRDEHARQLLLVEGLGEHTDGVLVQARLQVSGVRRAGDQDEADLLRSLDAPNRFGKLPTRLSGRCTADRITLGAESATDASASAAVRTCWTRLHPTDSRSPRISMACTRDGSTSKTVSAAHFAVSERHSTVAVCQGPCRDTSGGAVSTTL